MEENQGGELKADIHAGEHVSDVHSLERGKPQITVVRENRNGQPPLRFALLTLSRFNLHVVCKVDHNLKCTIKEALRFVVKCRTLNLRCRAYSDYIPWSHLLPLVHKCKSLTDSPRNQVAEGMVRSVRAVLTALPFKLSVAHFSRRHVGELGHNQTWAFDVRVGTLPKLQVVVLRVRGNVFLWNYATSKLVHVVDFGHMRHMRRADLATATSPAGLRRDQFTTFG
eukprot:g24238.t1